MESFKFLSYQRINRMKKNLRSARDTKVTIERRRILKVREILTEQSN